MVTPIIALAARLVCRGANIRRGSSTFTIQQSRRSGNNSIASVNRENDRHRKSRWNAEEIELRSDRFCPNATVPLFRQSF
jgi:hypothetical protein